MGSRVVVILVALTVVLGAGSAVAFASSPAQVDENATQDNETQVDDTGTPADDAPPVADNETQPPTVVDNETPAADNETSADDDAPSADDTPPVADNETDDETETPDGLIAENVEADEVQMQNVQVSNLTTDFSGLQDINGFLQDTFESSAGDNVEGLEVEAVELGNVQTATIQIDNNTATIDAELESITLQGVTADSVALDEAMSGTPSLIQQGDVTFESFSVQGLAVETFSGPGPAAVEEPAEPPADEPADNVTDEPADNVTDEPADNVTDEPVANETATPTDNVTDEPADNVTDEPADNVTEEPVVEEVATVSFEDQESDGTTVTVDSATLPSDGYVTIHNDSLLDGEVTGSVIGVSEYVISGTSEDVNITLFDVPGVEFNQTELEEDQTLIAMPHNETTDDETYDFVSSNGTDDGPFIANGSAVTDVANITIADEPVANETATPTDNVTEEPVDNETATPTDNVTEEPVATETATPSDNVTGAPVDDGTEEPVDNVTDEPVANETATPTDNVTDEPVATETATPSDNVTGAPVDDGTEEPVDNVTDEPVANETATPTDNVTEDNVTEEASVTFADQISNGETVRIDGLTLPEDGYVAIHNDSLLDGEVTGSVIGVSEYLEAGTYESGTVVLFDVPGVEFNQTELTESQTLIAMPHEETNDNESYDFVATDGAEDGPFTSDGEPVIDNATVNVE